MATTTKAPAKKKPAAPKARATVKKAAPKTVKVVATEKPAAVHATAHGKKVQYLYAVGRRKSAIARVRVYVKGDQTITINGKTLADYFQRPALQDAVQHPLQISALPHGPIDVVVLGGGIRSQAESVRHGISRALLLMDPLVRIPLKRAGFLTRDARVKERKKYGLKRARRAPQWQKR